MTKFGKIKANKNSAFGRLYQLFICCKFFELLHLRTMRRQEICFLYLDSRNLDKTGMDNQAYLSSLGA